MTEDREAAASLVRSGARIEILRQLRDSEASRYDLRERLDCSRTTVDRNLDRLLDQGWIDGRSNEYAITTSGVAVLERALAFLETVGTASRLQPILRWIPASGLDVDLRHLSDARMTLPDDGAPLAMVDRHTTVLGETSSFRAVLPLSSAGPLRAHQRRVTAGEADGTLVVTPSVADSYRSDPQFVEIVDALLAAENASIHVTEQAVPYYLGVLDATVQIGVDEDGQPRGLIETDDERVRAWADEQIEEYRSGAVPLDEWSRQ